MFERKSIETKAKNQSRSCRGISKSLETKSKNQNKACRRINRSTKTIYEYQSKKRLGTYIINQIYNQRFKKYLYYH